MFLPLILIAAAAAAQEPQSTTAPPVQVSAYGKATRGPGRLFISPIGEPFVGRTAGEDGLVVWFQQADANHDGMLTAAEMSADADRFFQMLDRTHDGEIDPDDIELYERLVPELRAVTLLSTSTLPGGGVEVRADSETSAGRLGLLQIPQPVASADRNFNRGVSPQEFRDAAVSRFQLLDSSHSGQLSLSMLQDIRRAAGAISKRREVKPGSSDMPNSAEYGRPIPQ